MMKTDVEVLYKYERKVYGTNFFKNSCSLEERTNTNPLPHTTDGFEFDSLSSDKEEDFESNFGNPFCSVSMRKRTLVVEKTEDKVSIKIFITNTARRVGRVYFEKTKNLYFFTYNVKTHDFYDGEIINYHKKRAFRKKLRRNQFWRQPMTRLMEFFGGFFSHPGAKLNKTLAVTEYDKVVNIFTSQIPNFDKNFLLTSDEALFKTRCDNLGYKLPDNWALFSKVYPTPTKKLLKKHNFKFIDALQSIYGLNGDKFKKIFHEITEINSRALEFSVDFFGAEFFKQQKIESILKILTHHDSWSFKYLLDNLKKIEFTKQEKTNFWNLFILTSDTTIDFFTLSEHIDFIVRLRNFGEQVKLRAKNQNQFITEHTEFSSLLQMYKKGNVYRHYNDDFVSRVETPIFDNEYYYPVLLTTTEEYNQESTVQSNCVRGYSDKPSSLIISLRMGSKTSNERATIEYNYRMMSGKIYMTNVQCLGRFNNKLTDDWSYVVRKLNERVQLLGSSNVFTLPELITKFKHKEIYQKATFDKNGYPHWDNGLENEEEDFFEMPI